jgi:hypothetical protein
MTSLFTILKRKGPKQMGCYAETDDYPSVTHIDLGPEVVKEMGFPEEVIVTVSPSEVEGITMVEPADGEQVWNVLILDEDDIDLMNELCLEYAQKVMDDPTKPVPAAGEYLFHRLMEEADKEQEA